MILLLPLQGYILTSEIDGTIQMKSYLSGNPEIRLALNEDVTIGRSGSSAYGIFLMTSNLLILDCISLISHSRLLHKIWSALQLFYRLLFFSCLAGYSSAGSGPVILDDCNFHESVHLDTFDLDRTLSLVSEI